MRIKGCYAIILVIVMQALLCQNLAAQAKLEAYPLLTGQVSERFAATAGGTAIPVSFYKGFHYLRFGHKGAVNLDIQLLQPADDLQLLPEHPFVNHDKGIRLRLEKPGYYVLSAGNGQKLFILADSLSMQQNELPGKVVSIAQYGADNTGKKSTTAQLQRAINETAAKGQTLYIGPGIYTTGTLRIGSNANIYLAGGCLLNASTDTADYAIDKGFSEANEYSAAAKKFSDNGEYMTFSRMILIENANNVTIRGRGIINGNGHIIRKSGKTPNLVRIRKSANVRIEGICLFDPAAWNTHILYSDQVTIRNIKMINDPDVKNTDGFDPDASTNVKILDCFAYCSDDNVAIKSTNNGGLLKNVENILVDGCVFLTKKSSLKVGTETRAAVMKNIQFSNNHVLEADRGMALYCSDGTTIEQVRFNNNFFGKGFADNEKKAIHFVIRKRNGAGMIRNIFIDNCHFSANFHRSIVLNGLDANHTIDNVVFSNIYVAGKKCTSLSNLELSKNEFVGSVTLKNN